SKTLPRDKLTFVALTTLEDTGRFMLLMASLRKFLVDAAEVKKLLLVVPDNQAFAFRSIASYSLKVPVEVVGEISFPILPRYVTMLLKLLVARYVDTEFYLTLDADTLLRTTFQLDKVMSNGRATYNQQSYSQGSNWFDSSASALQLINSPCMTIERLVSLYGSEFEVLMHALNVHGGFNSDNFWTEYTLYAIVACHEKLFSSFHKNLGNGIYAEDVSAVWLKVQAPYWNASLAFDEEAVKADAAPFTVFQSRTGTPVNEIAAHVQPYLRVSP
ncbi:hypothetical protein WJX84_008408, partial [Apatococcus fuscideae]